MEKKKNNLRKSDGNQAKRKTNSFFRAMNCSSLFCFNYFSILAKKCEKKSPNLPKKTRKRSMFIFVVYLPNSAPMTADRAQLSKPKHRLRYKWRQVSFTKYVFTNMWIWFTFLNRVWSWLFVLKFTFLPLF